MQIKSKIIAKLKKETKRKNPDEDLQLTFASRMHRINQSRKKKCKNICIYTHI